MRGAGKSPIQDGRERLVRLAVNWEIYRQQALTPLPWALFCLFLPHVGRKRVGSRSEPPLSGGVSPPRRPHPHASRREHMIATPPFSTQYVGSASWGQQEGPSGACTCAPRCKSHWLHMLPPSVTNSACPRPATARSRARALRAASARPPHPHTLSLLKQQNLKHNNRGRGEGTAKQARSKSAGRRKSKQKRR